MSKDADTARRLGAAPAEPKPCSQCGKPFSDSACGPGHAAVAAITLGRIYPSDEDPAPRAAQAAWPTPGDVADWQDGATAEAWAPLARASQAPHGPDSPQDTGEHPAEGDRAAGSESGARVHYEIEAYTDGFTATIHRTDSLDDARAHEGLPPGSRASTRIVRVTREVIR